LPREDILAAALAILDEQGADALSLRALAQRLGSGTATLYRHFDSRADLLAEVVDRIIGEIHVDPGPVAEHSWQDACASLARAMFDVLRRHRHAAPLVAQHIPMGPHAALQRERALGLLLSSGFSPALAVGAFTSISRHVLGFAMQLSSSAAAEESGEAAAVAAQVHALDPSRFPATAAVADEMPVPLEEEFEFGLRLIIAGLEAERAHEEGG
jgi:AcrR family transcriptional regulator